LTSARRLTRHLVNTSVRTQWAVSSAAVVQGLILTMAGCFATVNAI